MARREPSIESLRYEQAIEQLEELIDRIESGEIGLEESLKQYEAGMALIRRCRAILAQAEQKIAELTADEAAASGPAADEGEGGDEPDEGDPEDEHGDLPF